MKNLARKQTGFTIVELLIVIVVIAILASISIVAYNGIQQRAENAKTVQATSAWAKAIGMYKVDNGHYITINSCLGSSSTYTNTHNGRCWADSSNSTWVVNSVFQSRMSDYLNDYPEPSNKDVNDNDEDRQFRGAMYFIPSGDLDQAEIRVSLLGLTGSSECPSISGLDPPSSSGNRWVNGFSCRYKLPQ